MRIDSIPSHANAFQFGTKSAEARRSSETEDDQTGKSTLKSEKLTVEQVSAEQVSAEQQESAGGDQKGVIRNLLDGHYKGVAGVRLRINFFDELQALNNEATKEAVQNEVTSLFNTVNSEFDNLLQANELTGEQTDALEGIRQDFLSTTQSLLDNFLNNNETESSGFRAALDAQVASLEEALRALFEKEAPEELTAELTENVVDEIIDEVAPETAEEEPSILETFTEGLLSSISGLLESFDEALTSTTVLPELSEPSGNGGAFEKFLTIYNELQGAGQSSAPTEEKVETVA